MGYDIDKFIGYHILLSKEFLGDYKTLNIKPSPKISNIKENHLLKGLMLERVDMERRDHVENKLIAMLKHYEDSYAKGYKLLESFQKEKGVMRD